MKLDLTRLIPPGYAPSLERTLYLGGLICSSVYSLRFFVEFSFALDRLYTYEGKQRVLLEGAIMPDFATLIYHVFIGFALVAALMLCFIAVRYAYYRQGSRADYLVRRLPDRLDWHRRCLVLPVLAVLGCALAAFLLLLFYFAVYLLFTPDACLMPGQWYKIWRF